MFRHILPAVFLLAAPFALAEPISSLSQAINFAVTDNPEVRASWYGFEAAEDELRAGKGGYLPKVDLTGQVAWERTRTRDALGDRTENLDPYSGQVTLTQMLFDGLATKNEVARLSHMKKVRFYEFRQTSEEVALEVTRAYLDVLRHQKLVDLSKENYIQHRRILGDIEERVTAGIGRSVDLEQAGGRLALAESNLLTEATNLHDVSARFLRVVGEVPADELEDPEISEQLIPATANDALVSAYLRNPELNAAIMNIDASNASLDTQKAPMLPRLDLRLRQGFNNEADGFRQRINQGAIELVMSYNLYNGGSDKARKSQYNKLLNVAHELRVKICRDVRQETTIAYNDIQSLAQQVEFMDRNQLAIGKARVAYREQFDIGQRTLLDLLDTENEYFDVRRTYVNTISAQRQAKARTLASMGELLNNFDVNGQQDLMVTEADLERASKRCPLVAPMPLDIDKDALMAGLLEDKRFREVEGDKLAFRMDAQFEINSADLMSDDERDISDAAQYLKENPDINGAIEGHTDYTGSEAYNQDLSERRAKSVYDRLINAYGVNPERLSTKGFGETKPMADNGTVEGRALNRRVDMVIAKPE